MGKFLAALVLASIGQSGWTESLYTSEQLHRMITSSEYPPQGIMLDWEKRDVPLSAYEASNDARPSPFEACKVASRRIIKSFQPEFPTKEIFDDEWLYLAKAWSKDRITMVTCNHSDFSFIVSEFEYRY